MFLHVLRHINTDHCLLTSKYGLCQRFGKFGLTYTGRSKEKEGTDRAVWIFETDTASFDCLCDCLYCFFLTDHTFMKFFLKTCKTFRFTLCKTLYRDLGPVGNDVCHRCLCHRYFLSFVSAFFFFFIFENFCFYFTLARLKFFCQGKICLLDSFFLIFLDLVEFQFHGIYFRCHAVAAETYFGSCLVDNIDGLIRQKTVIDVTFGHFYCCFKCTVLDHHAMMLLIIRAQSLKDLDGFFL